MLNYADLLKTYVNVIALQSSLFVKRDLFYDLNNLKLFVERYKVCAIPEDLLQRTDRLMGTKIQIKSIIII